MRWAQDDPTARSFPMNWCRTGDFQFLGHPVRHMIRVQSKLACLHVMWNSPMITSWNQWRTYLYVYCTYSTYMSVVIPDKYRRVHCTNWVHFQVALSRHNSYTTLCVQHRFFYIRTNTDIYIHIHKIYVHIRAIRTFSYLAIFRPLSWYLRSQGLCTHLASNALPCAWKLA
jgi:hypothetical protein